MENEKAPAFTSKTSALSRGSLDFNINFTKKDLAALPTPTEKRAVWHDTKVRGLGLLVQPTGHKSFFWFRKVNGDPTWRTIGDFPDLSIEQARESADDFNKKLAEWKRKNFVGSNPFKRQDALTLATLFNSYYETLKTKGASPKRGPAWPRAEHTSGAATTRR